MVIVLTTVTGLCYYIDARKAAIDRASRARRQLERGNATGRLWCIYIARRRGVIQLIARCTVSVYYVSTCVSLESRRKIRKKW